MAKAGLKKGAEKEKMVLRKYKSFELRLEGKSYREIGQLQDISGAQAHNDVMFVLKSTTDDHKEKIEQLRAIEVQRLDKYLDNLSWKVNQGDYKAVEIALKIQERRARLLGLDMPVKVAHTNDSGDGPLEINVKLVD